MPRKFSRGSARRTRRCCCATAPFRICGAGDWSLWQLQEERFRNNARANLRLALLSLQSLQEIRAETGVQIRCGNAGGVMKIYRDPGVFDNGRCGCAMLAKARAAVSAGDAGGGPRIEPALERTSNTLAGALYFERDEGAIRISSLSGRGGVAPAHVRERVQFRHLRCSGCCARGRGSRRRRRAAGVVSGDNFVLGNGQLHAAAPAFHSAFALAGISGEGHLA